MSSHLRYAVRELRRRPGFALTAVLSLSLGIGATSAVFSVVYAVLIDPFPYPGSDRIMEVHLIDKSGKDRGPGFNGPQIWQLRKRSRSRTSSRWTGGISRRPIAISPKT